MRNLLLLAGLSLSLAASVPYAKHPRKSCWLELTKEKGDQCFSAEPECSKSCKPGEPVSKNYFYYFFSIKLPQICQPAGCVDKVNKVCKPVEREECKIENVTELVDK